MAKEDKDEDRRRKEEEKKSKEEEKKLKDAAEKQRKDDERKKREEDKKKKEEEEKKKKEDEKKKKEEERKKKEEEDKRRKDDEKKAKEDEKKAKEEEKKRKEKEKKKDEAAKKKREDAEKKKKEDEKRKKEADKKKKDGNDNKDPDEDEERRMLPSKRDQYERSYSPNRPKPHSTAPKDVQSKHREVDGVGKVLTLYRNGDGAFRVRMGFNSRVTRTWENLLDEIERKVPERTTRWGNAGRGARRLWTIDGGQKITSIEEIAALEDSKCQLVVGGPEPFEELDYAAIEKPPEKAKPREDVDYREKNKKKYGDVGKEGKIWERSEPPPTTRIMLYKSGDEDWVPKEYIVVPKKVPNWDVFLRDMQRLCPPKSGGKVECLFTLDGEEEIRELDQLVQGESYVVTDGDFQEIEGGYGAYEEPDPYEGDDPKAKGKGKQERSKNPRKGDKVKDTEEYDDNIWNEDDVKERDEEFIRAHKAAMNKRDGEGKRPKKDRIQNRADGRTTIRIHCFRNGAGNDPVRVSATLKQLDRGMPWLLEQCAAKYGLNPKSLHTVEGTEVKTVAELVHRGAYVLVPFGEKFREAWFFLPEDALDTSEEAQKEREKEANGGGGDDQSEYNEDGGRVDSRTESDQHLSRENSELGGGGDESEMDGEGGGRERSASQLRLEKYEEIISRLEGRISRLEEEKDLREEDRRSRYSSQSLRPETPSRRKLERQRSQQGSRNARNNPYDDDYDDYEPPRSRSRSAARTNNSRRSEPPQTRGRTNQSTNRGRSDSIGSVGVF